jgi:hypothetical protein
MNQKFHPITGENRPFEPHPVHFLQKTTHLPAGVFRLYKDKGALNHSLQGQNAWHDRISGKVPGQVKLIGCDPLDRLDPLFSFHLFHPIDHHCGERMGEAMKQFFPLAPLSPASVLSVCNFQPPYSFCAPTSLKAR